MPDNEQLSEQDYKDLQDISSKLPAGHPTQKKISLALSAQPTNFEKQNTPAPVEGGAGVRTAEGIGRGLVGLGKGMYNSVVHPIDTVNGMVSNTENEIGAAQQEPSTLGKVADYAAAVPGLGPLGKQLGERAGAGDVAGAVSEGLTTGLAPSAIGHGIGATVRGIAPEISRWRYEAPEKISLGPVGKINRNVPTPPVNPYEEMGNSAQYKDMAKDAAKPEPTVQSLKESPYATQGRAVPKVQSLSESPYARQNKSVGNPIGGNESPSNVIPEPREPGPTDKPGLQYSVKRQSDLVKNAKAGVPGAGEVLQQIKPGTIYEPREGVGYPGPRQSVGTPIENLPREPMEEFNRASQNVGLTKAGLTEGGGPTNMSPQEHADIEAQAGRELTPTEAIMERKKILEAQSSDIRGTSRQGGEALENIQENRRKGGYAKAAADRYTKGKKE